MTPRWIPTTDEVRTEFVMAQVKFKGVSLQFALDKFNAWMRRAEANIRADQNEQIIKMLEDKIAECDYEQVCKDAGYDFEVCDGCDENRAVIALIKVEK
jgi:hypothetical protein